MASAAGNRQTGKETTEKVKAVVNDDPEMYDTGAEPKDDAPASFDDPVEAQASKEMSADKDAFAADKESAKAGPDAEAIDAQPENDVKMASVGGPS